MTNRILRGKGPDGSMLIRASRPGYDVWSEPYGSSGISFDSRLTDIGTVVASGLITCGGSTVYFPAMNYVPVAKIALWTGAEIFPGDWVFRTSFAEYPNHFWIPAVAIITYNSIRVVAFENGMTSILPQYNPNGRQYMYSVFAYGG